MIGNSMRTAALAIVAAVGLIVASGGVAEGFLLGPEIEMSHEESSDDGPPSDRPSNASEANETVTTVEGILEATSGDAYALDGLLIDIGAAWYTNSTSGVADFDGDGTSETIRDEFNGLVGQSVRLTVESDGEEGDVLEVNGTQYREEGPPPWAGGPHGNGPPDHAGPDG